MSKLMGCACSPVLGDTSVQLRGALALRLHHHLALLGCEPQHQGERAGSM